MSEANVELARHVYEAFNQGDSEGTVADFAPAFEYVPSGAVPGSGRVYQGAEGWQKFVAQVFDEFDDARFEIHELVDAGDQVLAALTMWGRGKQSGVEASWHVWNVWTVREGKIMRGQGLTSRDQALEAAGLEE